MPIPTRGIEDYLITQGLLGITTLILAVACVLLYREVGKCRADQLKDAKSTLDKHIEATEKAAITQERMANVIEERNKTTQSLAESLKEFAVSFAHQTEMNKIFLKQALERLGEVAVKQEQMHVIQDAEVKAIAALGDSLRALHNPHARVIGRHEA